ncbi:uncharacterized protein LOC106083043 [Stomoxys calcitrans]|uniref:uncharacterized protein LOC106083043 n=1 Tax=Stomoxys calcitrans TaxID=35570 RepID=UPI0027E32430|nr:uncharacterized protein LOC106083043 [Stomoxys calcitrans]
MAFVKKSKNKYNNYMFTPGNFDACKFLKNRSQMPIANYLFTIIGDYTNLNHTCPYKGEIVIDRFRINMDRIKWIPMPPGDYGILSHFSCNGKEKFYLKIFFSFTD